MSNQTTEAVVGLGCTVFMILLGLSVVIPGILILWKTAFLVWAS